MTPTTNEAANTRTNNFSDSFAKKTKFTLIIFHFGYIKVKNFYF